MNVTPDKVKSIVTNHHCEKNALIAILQDIQAEYNYLPRKALLVLSHELNIPMVDIMSVATFYSAFSLEPRGEHTVTVCMGTACHVRGGPKIVEEFERKLGIETGHTTEDRQFSLETVACLGCCAIGPVVVVDNDYYAQTTIRNVDKILKKYRKKENNDEEHQET